MLYVGNRNAFEYELKAWFVYRYFCQDQTILEDDEYRNFYITLDAYFMKKYRCSTEEETRNGIKQLFQYESEQNIVVNSELINNLISVYKKCPDLLQ